MMMMMTMTMKRRRSRLLSTQPLVTPTTNRRSRRVRSWWWWWWSCLLLISLLWWAYSYSSPPQRRQLWWWLRWQRPAVTRTTVRQQRRRSKAQRSSTATASHGESDEEWVPNPDASQYHDVARPQWLSRHALEVWERIPPRAYSSLSGPLPCLAPKVHSHDRHPNDSSSLSSSSSSSSSSWRTYRPHDETTGLFFHKPTKVGGSTAAGVHLRMARNAADRASAGSNSNGNNNGNVSWPICFHSWTHGHARQRFDVSQRNASASRLWTIVRNPARRLVSLYFHFHVARRRQRQRQGGRITNITTNTSTATTTTWSWDDDDFRRYILEQPHDMNRDYYLKTASLRPPWGEGRMRHNHHQHHNDTFSQQPPQPTQQPQQSKMNYTDLLLGILYDYDFIAITERMDESMVALSMLWNVPLADVLYLSAKQGGSYDGGGFGECHYLGHYNNDDWPNNNGEITKVCNSREFQSLIQWDAVVYQLANRSLDTTIDQVLGREPFEAQLALFRQALKVARDECVPEVVTPCSGGGILASGNSNSNDNNNSTTTTTTTTTVVVGRPRPIQDTDCLASDSGCGFVCLDDVATRLDLWRPQAPVQYQFPGAFGQGPSTLKRLAAKHVLLPTRPAGGG